MAAIQQRAGPTDGAPYSFSSQPRVVAHRRKYRNSEIQDALQENVGFGNIMYDRRVVRGNTYALSTLPTRTQPDPVEVQRQQEAKRRAMARRRAKDHFQSLTPEPVAGRQHINVQTEIYLEELSDRIEEADVNCQTDGFLDRPPSPLFIPAKTCIDISTQIWEGDLFDFDIEVRPILEVMVGKTLEQSLIEVLEEEELASLRKQQREFLEMRNAELAEQQRLEEKERRHREEKARRMEQQKQVIVKEQETAEKIAAMAFAKSYLRDLVPTVFATLSDNGYFYDPVENDVEQGMIPWLMENVVIEVNRYNLSRRLMDAILWDVMKSRRKAYENLATLIEQEIANKKKLEQEAEGLKQAELLAAHNQQLGYTEKTEIKADDENPIDTYDDDNPVDKNDDENPDTESQFEQFDEDADREEAM